MLKFFDDRNLSEETSAYIAVLAEALRDSNVADDKQDLAQKLLDITILHEPYMDRAEAKSVIMRYISNPDFLLFVAGAATLFGNVSYVSQFSNAAQRSSTFGNKALNLIHVVIFTSFTLEKMVDIGKSSLSNSAFVNRREALSKVMGFMKHNYPLLAGAWLTFNQVASGSVFAAQAIHNNRSKEAITSGMRAMAAAASVGLTLYKYHTILDVEKRTGKSLVDVRVRRAIAPVDRVLGGVVDRLGNAFPYMAAGMLTGPHVSIFYNKITDQEHPTISWASLSTILGYSSFVAYLASKHDVHAAAHHVAGEVDEAITHSLEMCDGFSGLIAAMSQQAQSDTLRVGNVRALMQEHLPIGERAAVQLTQLCYRPDAPPPSLYILAKIIAHEYAALHIWQLQHAMPEGKRIDEQTVMRLRQKMSGMLMDVIADQRAALEAQRVNHSGALLTRRQFLRVGK